MHCIEPEKLYQRDPQIKRENVKILQEWLKKQPHLPEIEESQVIIFLHSCLYSLQATKTAIDCYFTRRTLRPELFCCPPQELITKTFSANFKTILPKKTPEGYAVLLAGLLDYKPEKYNFNNSLLLVNLAYSLYVHQHGFVDGVVVVADLKGSTLGHLTRVNLSSQKCMLEYLQEGMPLRLKGIHVVNSVPFMDKVLGLIKPLMTNTLFELIQIHSTVDTLYEYVPKECLPKEYGGGLPSCQKLHEETVKGIFDNSDFWKWHDSQKVNETKRIEKLNGGSSTFGMEGSFNRLEID